MSPKVFVTALKALSIAASTDEARAHINCVRFGFVDGEKVLTMCATNGHWLAEYTFPGTDYSEVHETLGDASSALISLADVQALIKKIDAKSKIPIEIVIGAKEIRVIERGSSHPFAPVDAQFPPTKQVIPPAWCRDVLPDGSIGLSATLLADVMKAFQALHQDRKATNVLRFDFGGSGDPVRITSETSALLAVVMPCRIEVKRDAPARQTSVKNKSKVA